MSQEVAVSVICLVFNHEEYLKKCLDGFVGQKTGFIYEVIVHDDKSTDGSIKIIKEYAQKYPNIIKPFFEEENQYSKGKRFIIDLIRGAKGKYIAFCEGDDYWTDPLKLQKQFDFMEQHSDYSMCVHNTIIHDLMGEQSDELFFKVHNNEIVEMNAQQVFDDWVVHTSSYFIRNNYDIFPAWSRIYFSGDYIMLVVAYAHGKIAMLPEAMSVYNFRNENGVTHKNAGSRDLLQKVFQRAVYLEKYLEKLDVDEKAQCVIKNRVEAIKESSAIHKTCIELIQKQQSQATDKEKMDFLIDEMKDELSAKWMFNPAEGLETRCGSISHEQFFDILKDYITSLTEERYVVHFSYIPWLIKWYESNRTEKEYLLAVAAHPDNEAGWGLNMNETSNRIEVVLTYSKKELNQEDKNDELLSLKKRVMDFYDTNQMAECLENIKRGLDISPLDQDLVLFKAFVNFRLGKYDDSLDDIGIYSLFYGLESDVEYLYQQIIQSVLY